MPVPSLLQPFIEPLERLGLPYCITGSVAASIYGEPRLTADIDVVLMLEARAINRFTQAFPEEAYYVPPLEMIHAEAGRAARGMFNVIHLATQFKADFYLVGTDPLQQWAVQHRRRIDLDGDGAWVAPPEYVIIKKLEFLREGSSDKHVRDVRLMLAATPIDRLMLEREVARRSLLSQWQRCESAS